jgi:hypothetical protein
MESRPGALTLRGIFDKQHLYFYYYCKCIKPDRVPLLVPVLQPRRQCSLRPSLRRRIAIDAVPGRALEGLWSAVKADDPNQVSVCLIVLDREDESADGPSNRLFERVLEVAGYVSAHGICAWQVFIWFELHYSSMSDEQKRKTRDFMAANYGGIVEDTAALEVAEWVGRFGNEWALSLIEEWIARRATFRPTTPSAYVPRCRSSSTTRMERWTASSEKEGYKLAGNIMLH